IPVNATANIGITECDRLATSGTDPDRVEGVTPVSTDTLNAARVISACKKALAEHPDHRRLQAALARGYLAVSRYDEAYVQASRAAENGSVYALYQTGHVYETYRGDKDKALETYERAANAGQIDAMVALAWMLFFRNDWGDKRKGQAWMEKAASSGTPFAQANLGSWHVNSDVKNNIAPNSSLEKAYP